MGYTNYGFIDDGMIPFVPAMGCKCKNQIAQLKETIEFLKPSEMITEEIQKGGEFKLVKNLDVEKGSLTLVNNTKLDLGGNEVISEGGTYGDTVVVGNGADVTISNGEIKPAEKASQANQSATILIKTANTNKLILNDVKVTGIYPLYVNSANENTLVIINGGEIYTTIESDNPDKMNPSVYVGKGTSTSTIGGKVIINDGVFGRKGVVNNYLLNVEDILRKQEGKEPRDFIEVRGGKYWNFSPSNNKAEGAGTNFVANGYHVETTTYDNDTLYTVVKD